MINRSKILSVIEGYKQHFPEHWADKYDEKFKWEAVKHFQDNWDIEAGNFGEMFKKATDKTYTLLASGYAYPRKMILEFAKADDNAVREMFRRLYDESLDLSERVTAFIDTSEELRNKYNNGTWKNHYQNTSYISTYLWLMYPDKYYIYKYELYRAVAKEFDDSYLPQKGGGAKNMIDGFKMYDEICEILNQDTELRQMLDSVLTDSCYKDSSLKTMTIDFGFYIGKYYNNDKGKAIASEDEWFPSFDEYTPGITKDEWLELLHDEEIIGPVWGGVLAAFYAVGGSATCKQIAQEYNRNVTEIHNYCTHLARRIYKKTNCPLYPRENEKDRYWTILFQGKSADTKTDGVYVWKLRPELFDALTEFDIMRYQWEIPDNNEKEPYTKEDFLKEVFITESEYDMLRSLVLRKKNIIIQGAPGVGKTFSAKRLAYSIIGEKNESRICMVQFHQNYSYEDFIMGYRPNDSGGFGLQSGVFYNFCIRCRENPDKPYFFIIDEINRGNLSKIFGELLMLIETDKRGETHQLKLVYGGETFYIPENLHIIGMMNTADRSLAMIDYALRRRFSFYTMQPAFEKAADNGFGDHTQGISCPLYHTVIARIKELNNVIRNDSTLGKGFEIGHSYFVPEDISVIDDEWVRSVVRYEIIPLIEEYWFDNDKKLNEWAKSLCQAIGEEYDGR